MQSTLIKERARKLRKEMTEVEIKLWNRLRRRQLGGLRFRRQVCFDQYIVDFACFEPKIIIELDGSQHQYQIDYDEKRTHSLESLGYVVLRFWNCDVNDSFDDVLAAIWNQCSPPSVAARQLPPAEEAVLKKMVARMNHE